jgi:hypothetical protein
MNYEAHARSNYFRVKDMESFRAFLSAWGNDVTLRPHYDDAELVCLLSTGEGGFPSHDDDTDEPIYFPQLVAEHLADDEVAVFVECWHEGLRYVGGDALAINNKGETVIIHTDDIYGLAAKLGANVTLASE